MTAKPPLREEEVARILALLEPLSEDRSIVLVGGQAVTFWTRFLAGRSSKIGSLAPLASKDLDFEGSARTVRRAAELLGARMRLAGMDDHTPNTGIVLFVDTDGMCLGALLQAISVLTQIIQRAVQGVALVEPLD